MQPGSGINLFGFALIRITSPTSTPQTRLQKRGNNKAPRCLGTSPVPNSTSTPKPTDDHPVLSRKPESNKEYKKRETKMKNARRCADSSMSCGDAAPYRKPHPPLPFTPPKTAARHPIPTSTPPPHRRSSKHHTPPSIHPLPPIPLPLARLLLHVSIPPNILKRARHRNIPSPFPRSTFQHHHLRHRRLLRR